jgi:hypothetical protein
VLLYLEEACVAIHQTLQRLPGFLPDICIPAPEGPFVFRCEVAKAQGVLGYRLCEWLHDAVHLEANNLAQPLACCLQGEKIADNETEIRVSESTRAQKHDQT